MMVVLLLSVGVVAAVMLAMAIGVLMSRPCLRGSCGALGLLVDEGGGEPCETCPLRESRGRGARDDGSGVRQPASDKPQSGASVAGVRRH